MKRLVLLVFLMLILSSKVQASEPLSPVRAAELRIRDERLEHVVVFDNDGNVIGESIGTDRLVTAPDVRLYGVTVLHNHPMLQGGSPFFSVLDIRFAAFYNIQRSIVIAPVYIAGEKLFIECTIDRGQAKYWPIDIVTDYNPKTLHPDSFKMLTKRAMAGPIYPLWWEYAARHGLEYKCEVLP